MLSAIVKNWLILMLIFPSFLFWGLLIFSGFSGDIFMNVINFITSKYFASQPAYRSDFWLIIIKITMIISLFASFLTSLIIIEKE